MKLKEQIQKGEKLSGTLLNFGDTAVGVILGRAGYDFIWIDMEHSCLSLEKLMSQIVAIKAGGTSVIVRVPQDDLTYLKKILEMGVDGIIFPMIKTAKQANEYIAHTLYPPYGTRGFGPQNAVGYGFDDEGAYVANTREHLCRFIQIEQIDAVENLDEIIQNEYIDGYIFGPNDLSGSLGALGQVFGEATENAMKRAMEKLKSAGKYVGLATGDTSEKTIRHWHDFGADMLAISADYSFLQKASLENRKTLDRLHKGIADNE